jgi:hypothetical protein
MQRGFAWNIFLARLELGTCRMFFVCLFVCLFDFRHFVWSGCSAERLYRFSRGFCSAMQYAMRTRIGYSILWLHWYWINESDLFDHSQEYRCDARGWTISHSTSISNNSRTLHHYTATALRAIWLPLSSDTKFALSFYSCCHISNIFQAKPRCINQRVRLLRAGLVDRVQNIGFFLCLY